MVARLDYVHLDAWGWASDENIEIMACMTGARRRNAGSWWFNDCSFFTMLFNICLRAKDRVMKNLPCVCVSILYGIPIL
jgi:hypothetical protein